MTMLECRSHWLNLRNGPNPGEGEQWEGRGERGRRNQGCEEAIRGALGNLGSTKLGAAISVTLKHIWTCLLSWHLHSPSSIAKSRPSCLGIALELFAQVNVFIFGKPGDTIILRLPTNSSAEKSPSNLKHGSTHWQPHRAVPVSPSTHDLPYLWALWGNTRNGLREKRYLQGTPVALLFQVAYPVTGRSADPFLSSRKPEDCIWEF